MLKKPTYHSSNLSPPLNKLHQNTVLQASRQLHPSINPCRECHDLAPEYFKSILTRDLTQTHLLPHFLQKGDTLSSTNLKDCLNLGATCSYLETIVNAYLKVCLQFCLENKLHNNLFSPLEKYTIKKMEGRCNFRLCDFLNVQDHHNWALLNYFPEWVALYHLSLKHAMDVLICEKFLQEFDNYLATRSLGWPHYDPTWRKIRDTEAIDLFIAIVKRGLQPDSRHATSILATTMCWYTMNSNRGKVLKLIGLLIKNKILILDSNHIIYKFIENQIKIVKKIFDFSERPENLVFYSFHEDGYRALFSLKILLKSGGLHLNSQSIKSIIEGRMNSLYTDDEFSLSTTVYNISKLVSHKILRSDSVYFDIIVQTLLQTINKSSCAIIYFFKTIIEKKVINTKSHYTPIIIEKIMKLKNNDSEIINFIESSIHNDIINKKSQYNPIVIEKTKKILEENEYYGKDAIELLLKLTNNDILDSNSVHFNPILRIVKQRKQAKCAYDNSVEQLLQALIARAEPNNLQKLYDIIYILRQTNPVYWLAIPIGIFLYIIHYYSITQVFYRIRFN